MRVAAFVLALLGAASSGFLGAKWLSDYNKLQTESPYKELLAMGREAAKTDPKAKEKFDELDRLVLTAYILLAGAALGIVCGVLVLKGHGIIGGLILLVAGSVPAVTSGKPEIIIFTFLLLLAGLMGLFVRKPEAKPGYGRPYRRDDRDDDREEDDRDRPRERGRGRDED